MSAVCFYFQVHQPLRIRRFSYFNSPLDQNYFDEDLNRKVIEKVAEKCYLPANELVLKLIERHQGEFRISFSISGILLEQLKRYSPATLESFVKLASSGCVEFIGETYYHSLAALFNDGEFRAQVKRHSDLINELFGQTPVVFRNTELIHDDRIGHLVAEMGYKALIVEGPDDILNWKSPNFVYSCPGSNIPLLLKNFRLSDDIAFRFSQPVWDGQPLTAENFANRLHQLNDRADLVNLFMDYETFGEHHWAESGIFGFLEHLPQALLYHPNWCFCTPSEAANRFNSVDELSYWRTTSWADSDRDVSAWRGNRMQNCALDRTYRLQKSVIATNDEAIIDLWRMLQISDHFYYMSTKRRGDGNVHKYFSPFESPYDAFVYYMNVLKNFEKFVDARAFENDVTGATYPSQTVGDCA